MPNGEVPFKKWKSVADRLLQNKDVSDDKVKEYIFRSLLGTPDDIVDQCRSWSARVIIEVLNKNYGGVVDGEKIILSFGIPACLHFDQGGLFEAKIINNLCKLLGISKSRTTPYYQMGNGKTEKMNSTFLTMLRTLTVEKRVNGKNMFLVWHMRTIAVSMKL